MRRLIFSTFAIVLVAGIAIATALLVTPMQSVSAAGQTVRVGVAAPTASLSGPGELDLFGQRFETEIDFVGPVRPRLELTRIELSPQLAALIQPDGSEQTGPEALQQALVDGWVRYFTWQVAIVALVTILALGAIAGWRRMPRKNTIAFVVIGLLVTEAVNLGAIMVTAYSAPEKLRQVNSLQELVGVAPEQLMPTVQSQAPAQEGLVVVVGDSTAAGIGNPLVPDASPVDRACARSVDSFANVLDRATDWRVLNLACSGATIREGLLGPQETGGVTVPPQLPDAIAAGPSAIIMNIGANDVNWSGVLRMCVAIDDCRNNALDAFFEQQMSSFTRDYLTLLMWLRSIPDPPPVIVNLYYDPFAGDIDCLKDLGVTEEKMKVLNEHLDAINDVLEYGAESASFTVGRPDFTGHGLCADQPYVQGVKAKAPFHPTAAGALAIALASQEALRSLPQTE